MQLTSVNLGQLRPDPNGEPGEMTGLYKFPVAGPVKLNSLGLEGDVIVSVRHHGGPDQAVYVYGGADYEWWADELGRKMEPGLFGENLTISELESPRFLIGDLLLIGDGVMLQVTAPRIPCATFAARMGDSQFIKKFRDAGRPGLYCRVLQDGFIQAGDPVRVERFTGETVRLLEIYRDHYEPEKTEAAIRRILAAPISIRLKERKERQLEKVLAGVE